MTAGAGTDERFKGSGKIYRFRPKSQLAALGMVNNINRSGFSFSDYINFSGGMQSLASGGNFSLELNSADNMPVDFGQPVTGIVTSGALGLNYGFEKSKNRRFSLSYLGNGVNKKLNEQTWSRNFARELDYITEGNSNQRTDNIVHRLNANLRNDMDSFTQVIFSASGELSDAKQKTWVTAHHIQMQYR